MWDVGADGYARGEGFAAIVIKSLKKAIADQDDIDSVIRNTGVNQDGRSAGLTVPSAVAQASLITSTYEGCGLDCLNEDDRCQYFEAHGTGMYSRRVAPCWLGSTMALLIRFRYSGRGSKRGREH